MSNRNQRRRTVLRTVGATAGTVLAAGCLSGADDGNGTENETETQNGGENGTTDDDADAEDEGETDQHVNPEAWTDVETIELRGVMNGWEGVAPDPIAGETNPTLVLFAGQEYTFTWTNADGRPHNIELWDETGELVDDDYGTDLMQKQGETQTLDGVTASEEIATYRCKPHDTMEGDVRIVSE
ncbi:plastocyanin/azurin family copper-binding protein [Natrialba sp. PRR66]|uniref:cupredoxin domain-containing protein n=1 Tax=Natrialba sp. PRR66 TaxID=3098146 RepID=UPI002B1E6E42|nr:plastocyanin/azurin family copper-binding protein [Natrialba sp. PRR66]